MNTLSDEPIFLWVRIYLFIIESIGILYLQILLSSEYLLSNKSIWLFLNLFRDVETDGFLDFIDLLTDSSGFEDDHADILQNNLLI